MPMNFSIKSSNQIVKAHCAPRIILGYSSVLLSGFATASHDSRPAFPSASTSPCESTNGVSMNGTSAAGTPNSSWRPIKSNSASCSGVTTTSAGAPCLEGTVRRRHEQGHGEPGLAQGEGRLGAWNARSLADEPVVRLILDGTVVDVRLDHKATAISLLVVLGVRMVRRCCSRSRRWAGRAATPGAASSTDLISRGLCRPDLRDRCPPTRRCLSETTLRCKTPRPASGRTVAR
jgi:hypothetical protein